MKVLIGMFSMGVPCRLDSCVCMLFSVEICVAL